MIGQGSFGRVFLVRLVGGGGIFLNESGSVSSGNEEERGFFAMKVLRKEDVARRYQVRTNNMHVG